MNATGGTFKLDVFLPGVHATEETVALPVTLSRLNS